MADDRLSLITQWLQTTAPIASHQSTEIVLPLGFESVESHATFESDTIINCISFWHTYRNRILRTTMAVRAGLPGRCFRKDLP
jgi:hypothetical protein